MHVILAHLEVAGAARLQPLARLLLAASPFVGDAGELVDPYNTDAICHALAELLETQSRREELARRGLERARRFTWPQVAEQTLEVYGRSIIPACSALA